MQRLASVAFVVAVVGCGKAKESAPATGSGSVATPTGSAAPGSGSASASIFKSKYDAPTLKGQPLVVERALVKALPDGRAQLYLGKSGTCEQLLSNLFDGKDPHVLVDIATLLLADGTEGKRLSDVYAGPPATFDHAHARAEIRGELAKGKQVEIEMRIETRDPEVKLEGTVTAEVCGEQDMPPPATADAPMLTIEGKPFVIRTGLKRGDDVELVDLPRDCQSAKYIGVRLQRERGTWKLDGKRLPVPADGPAPKLTVKPAPTKESLPPGRVLMTLDGTDKLGEYEVAIAGKVEMIDCNAK